MALASIHEESRMSGQRPDAADHVIDGVGHGQLVEALRRRPVLHRRIATTADSTPRTNAKFQEVL